MSKILQQFCNLLQTQLEIGRTVTLPLCRNYHRKPVRKVRPIYPTIHLPKGRVISMPEKYTTKPLPYRKNSGRDEKGHVVVGTRGGGHKQNFRMVDNMRTAPEGKVLEERVQKILYDPIRTGRIALVASGTHKRYIMATSSMKEGDVVTTSKDPTALVRVTEGDARPLGALPIGTVVHNIEQYPACGGTYCRAGGTCAQITRKTENSCTLLLPSKREIELDPSCMAVVGRVSNENHAEKPIGSANRLRWLGFRPRSGQKSHKTGYDGRKVKPPKPLNMLVKKEKFNPPIYQMKLES